MRWPTTHRSRQCISPWSTQPGAEHWQQQQQSVVAAAAAAPAIGGSSRSGSGGGAGGYHAVAPAVKVGCWLCSGLFRKSVRPIVGRCASFNSILTWGFATGLFVSSVFWQSWVGSCRVGFWIRRRLALGMHCCADTVPPFWCALAR